MGLLLKVHSYMHIVPKMGRLSQGAPFGTVDLQAGGAGLDLFLYLIQVEGPR
jgi:hypothetical protein